MTEPTLLQNAAGFVSGLTFEALPAAAVATATLGFTDTLAALVAGRPEPVVAALERYLDGVQAGGDVSALLGERRLAAEHAALLDATAAHALDYDDYAFANHPSSVMVPAIMAAAQLSGQAVDGKAMATAYVAGYEVWAEIMSREPDHLHSKGWHPTAVFGPIGATAACASVLRLDAQRTAHAIGLAVAHAGGVMGNFGSMAKPYHAGRAAEAGLRCCALARAGMTATMGTLDGDTGLLAALSPNGKADRSPDAPFGTRWHIEKTGLNIKKYPTVGASQRVVDAVLALRDRDDIDYADVVRIVPRVSVKYAKLMAYADPKDAAEAKFSLAFAAAAALHFGRLGLAELEPAALADPELRRLIAAVEVDAVEEYDPDYPVPAPFDMATITLSDGRVLETDKVLRATGHVDRPLSTPELKAKFMACATYGKLPAERAETLFDAAQDLPNLPSVAPLLVVSKR